MNWLRCLIILAVSGLAPGAPSTTAPAVAPEDRGTLRVVCFGDSITGDTPGKRLTYQGQYLKFADLLQLKLEGRLGKAHVLNSGWAGDRTFKQGDRPGAINRVNSDILQLHPDIAVILIGGNDNPKTDEDRKRTSDNLRSIVKQAKDAGIRVLLIQYHDAVITPQNEKTAWRHLSAVNPLIAQVAGELDVPILDMRPAIAAAAVAYPPGEVCNTVDGVHLGLRGEWAYAQEIFAKLDSLGWINKAK